MSKALKSMLSIDIAAHSNANCKWVGLSVQLCVSALCGNHLSHCFMQGNALLANPRFNFTALVPDCL